MTTRKKKVGAKAEGVEKAPAKRKTSGRGKKPAVADAEPPALLPPAAAEPVSPELAKSLAEREAATVDITFADLGLSAAMLASLERSGYSRPTPIQQQAVPLALKGRDLMGLAQTGTGKTAAFTIPIIERLMGGPSARARWCSRPRASSASRWRPACASTVRAPGSR
jgi:ATP-dependent helicase YprA (DUF1998 family)